MEALDSMLVKSFSKGLPLAFSLSMASSVTSSNKVILFTFLSLFYCVFHLKFKFGLLFGTIRLNYDFPIFN